MSKRFALAVLGFILVLTFPVPAVSAAPTSVAPTTLSQALSDPLRYAEVWSAIASIGQCLIVTLTAIFAWVTIYLGYKQVRHAQSGNQMAALRDIHRTVQSDLFLTAQEAIFTQGAREFEDPEFRYQFVNFNEAALVNRELIAKARIVGNFYENLGRLVRHNLVDRNLVLEAWSPAITGDWKHLEGMTILGRRASGDVMWENFEYLTILARGWLSDHRAGTFPADSPRIDLEDKWRKSDEQYAISRKSGDREIPRIEKG
jgi:hypothetical protein